VAGGVCEHVAAGADTKVIVRVVGQDDLARAAERLAAGKPQDRGGRATADGVERDLPVVGHVAAVDVEEPAVGDIQRVAGVEDEGKDVRVDVQRHKDIHIGIAVNHHVDRVAVGHALGEPVFGNVPIAVAADNPRGLAPRRMGACRQKDHHRRADSATQPDCFRLHPQLLLRRGSAARQHVTYIIRTSATEFWDILPQLDVPVKGIPGY